MMDRVLWEQETALRDRHRTLLNGLGIHQVVEKLEEIEEALRYGMDGEQSILEQQVVGIRYQGEVDRLAAGVSAPDLLLVTVGYSPEPLLISMAYHAPKNLGLLLAKQLKDLYLDSLRELWDTLRGVLELPNFDSPTILRHFVRDNPAELFQVVRSIVEGREDRAERIVLDITGAKKSMVAGAFLAAGYLDIEASYVDFDNYDPVLRRPEPGRCQPVELPNPYRIFQLKEQSRFEEAFRRRRYEECRKLVATTCQALANEQAREFLSVDESNQMAARLGAFDRLAEACFLWSEGFYADAGECFSSLAPSLEPPTVALLRDVWPRRGDTSQEIAVALEEDRILNRAEVPLAYFLDVLIWHNEDSVESRPRTSFLRLYGAIESMIFFALHAFVGRSPQRVTVESEPIGAHQRLAEKFPRNRRGEVLEWDAIWGQVAVGWLRLKSSEALLVLRADKGGSGRFEPRVGLQKLLKNSIDREVVEAAEGIKLRASCSLRPLGKELALRLNLSDDFVRLRNKVVHWLAPVPVETALDLLGRFRDAVRGLVPQVVEEFARGADPATSQMLFAWKERLLRAVDGEFDPEFVPPTFAGLPRDLHLNQSKEASS